MLRKQLEEAKKLHDNGQYIESIEVLAPELFEEENPTPCNGCGSDHMPYECPQLATWNPKQYANS